VNKNNIRKKIIELRKNNISKNIEINSQNIFQILKKYNSKSKIIGGYYPTNFEVDDLKILNHLEKKNYIISLPKIKKNNQMDFFEWSEKDPLEINNFGIPEPVYKTLIYPDILLVPLIAFDKSLNRLGYGGGFYDRYIYKIKKKKKILTIGLAFSYQEINKIPTNQFDQQLDFVVTENNILK